MKFTKRAMVHSKETRESQRVLGWMLKFRPYHKFWCFNETLPMTFHFWCILSHFFICSFELCEKVDRKKKLIVKISNLSTKRVVRKCSDYVYGQIMSIPSYSTIDTYWLHHILFFGCICIYILTGIWWNQNENWWMTFVFDCFMLFFFNDASSTKIEVVSFLLFTCSEVWTYFNQERKNGWQLG